MSVGPEDDARWNEYVGRLPKPAAPAVGKTVEKPDAAFTSDQIEEKLTWIARDLLLWPDYTRISTVGEHWESGASKSPTLYDVKHYHINRLLDLREMIETGAIHPVTG
jgi:hypothetical protein